MKRVGLCIVFFLSSLPLFLTAQEKPIIIQRPITWDAERERLSLAYLQERHGIRQTSVDIIPKMVVVHWTDVLSVDKTIGVFNPVRLPGRPQLQKASLLNVSAHFVVGRDGRIFQLLPETTFARHTIGLNYCAIGIENVGSARYPLTAAQLDANTKLIQYLMSKYGIQYVIGHHEYQAFKGTSWWKETNPNYITEKVDPGAKFMDKLRFNLGMSHQLAVQ